MRHPLAAATLLALTAAPVAAKTSCAPIDNTARILSSPSPNAIHPQWRGENFIGTAWTLEVSGNVIRRDGVMFRRGDLYSPRGGLMNRGVYILEKEWTCQ